MGLALFQSPVCAHLGGGLRLDEDGHRAWNGTKFDGAIPSACFIWMRRTPAAEVPDLDDRLAAPSLLNRMWGLVLKAALTGSGTGHYADLHPRHNGALLGFRGRLRLN